jgi:hypothetical protein
MTASCTCTAERRWRWEPPGFKFAIAECVWEEIPISGLPVGRYEHTAGLIEGGLYVHGGHANGDFVDDTYFFPL